MKKIVTTALLAATLLAGAAIGAESDAKPARVYAPFHKLEMSPDQKAKIAAIQADYRAKIKALEEEMHAKVLAALTDEQKAAFAKQEEETRKKRAEYAKKYREQKKAEEGKDGAPEKKGKDK